MAVGSSSSSSLEREHAQPLVDHTAGWCRQRGRGGQGNSQDRCPDCSQQVCPDSSPRLACTQSFHILHCFDVESPRPSLTRGPLRTPDSQRVHFILGLLRGQEEGGDLGSCWLCLCYCVPTDSRFHPFSSVSIKWPDFHHWVVWMLR